MRHCPVQKRSIRERGVTLWLVILILGMALAASLGASALVLGEIQQTRVITDSVTAFFAADAGSEQALYQLCKQDNRDDQLNQPIGAAQYSYRVQGGANDRYVVSTGSFRNSRRAIEVAGFTEDAGVIDCGVAQAVGPALDFGTGADGNGNAAAATINLNQASVVGRPNPDAVKFQIGGLGAGAASINLGVAPSGLAAGDEILVIGLQAPGGGDPINAGNWETVRISSIAGTTLNLSQPLTKNYPPTTLVQRVPNYNSLTINASQTYTINDWTGLAGGVLFIRVKNTLTIGTGGKITVVGKGFRGGNVGYMHYEDPPGCDCWNNDWGRAGEGIDGLAPIYDSYYTDTDGSLTRQPNYGGGGGASGRVVGGGGGGYGSGAGGGNYEGPNVNTFLGCRAGSGSTRYGLAGGTYGGDLSTKLYLGSGGGGGNDVSGAGFYAEYGTAGGDGGGVLAIYSKNIDNQGEITANGASSQGNPGVNPYYSTGGGGSGGSLLIRTDGFINIGAINNDGGTGGSAFGTGCGVPPNVNGRGGNGGAGVSSVQGA